MRMALHSCTRLRRGRQTEAMGCRWRSSPAFPRRSLSGQQSELLESRAAMDTRTETSPQLGLSLEPQAEHPALELLEKINPDELTPREALDLLYELKAAALEIVAPTGRAIV